MGSVSNPALSCPSYGAVLQEIPSSSSNSKLAVLSRTGLVAFKRLSPSSSSRRSRRKGTAARAGQALLETAPASIDIEGIVAEAPRLLALSSDLNWKQSVSELREEALGGLSARGEGVIAFARLSASIDGWLHDRVLASVLQPSLLPSLQARQDPQEELGVRIRVEELRWQAVLQATEELASGVDSSFDWESEVAELRQCLVNQEGFEREQKLWSCWESSRQGMYKDAQSLHDEALKSLHADDSYLTLFPDKSREKEPVEEEKSEGKAFEISGTWWTLGILATAGLFGASSLDAIAADESLTSALTQAPSWVAPSVLAFPVASYLLFTLYRNNVDPYAKLTDWMFGLVAMAIVGNIVLIATVGVRLY